MSKCTHPFPSNNSTTDNIKCAYCGDPMSIRKVQMPKKMSEFDQWFEDRFGHQVGRLHIVAKESAAWAFQRCRDLAEEEAEWGIVERIEAEQRRVGV